MATVADDLYLGSMPASDRELADRFLEFYYGARRENLTWGNTQWLGVKTLRCPLDLWLYQEIIFETRPGLIVETGTAHGGGALFLASMCDLVKHGEVISIDIVQSSDWPRHPRLTYLTGSSVGADVVKTVRQARGRRQANAGHPRLGPFQRPRSRRDEGVRVRWSAPAAT